MDKVLKYAKRENYHLLGKVIEERLALYRKVIASEESDKKGARMLLTEILNLQKMQVLCDDLEEVEAKRVVDSLSEAEVSEVREKVTEEEGALVRVDKLLANRPYPQEKIVKSSVIGNI